MDSQDKSNSNSSTSSVGTSHLGQSSSQKKSHKGVVVLVIVLVVIVLAAVGGWALYNKSQNDKKTADANAAAAQMSKPLTPEQQVTKTLTDNVNKQTSAIEQGDDSSAITNSTAVATSVGRNLNAQNLKN